jgi:hypothetical protein
MESIMNNVDKWTYKLVSICLLWQFPQILVNFIKSAYSNPSRNQHITAQLRQWALHWWNENAEVTIYSHILIHRMFKKFL